MAICASIMCMSSRSGLARYPAFRHSPPETVHNSHNEPNRTERQSATPSGLHPRPFWVISLAINLLVTFLHRDITLIHNPSFSLILPALPIPCRPFASPISFFTRQNLSSRTPISLPRSSTPTVRIHIRLLLLSPYHRTALEDTFDGIDALCLG